uniref:Uncharacterized protein n=1 Tax=Acrobeloides nanus TaxID=290746 RepID=A0A914D7Y8_9BILA
MGYRLRKSTSSIVLSSTLDGDGKLSRSTSAQDLTAFPNPKDNYREPYRNFYNSWAYYGNVSDYWYNPQRYYQRPYPYSFDYDRYPYSYWYRNTSTQYDWGFTYPYQRYVSPSYSSYLRDLYYRPHQNYWNLRNYYSPYWYTF